MNTAQPVLFIHGLWLHASSWAPWIDAFNEAGYDSSAPGWPGDPDTVAEARRDPHTIADHGIDDVVEHYTQIILALPVKPILIGHSFPTKSLNTKQLKRLPAASPTPRKSLIWSSCSSATAPRTSPL